jgi:hypothetical protein
LKRRDRQSLFDPPSVRRPTDPPGLRRLRFPFFEPLVKEPGAASQTIGAAVAVPSRRKRGPSPGEPGSLASKPVIAAHCRAPVRGTRACLTNTKHTPCQLLNKDFLLVSHVVSGPQRAAKRPPLQRTQARTLAQQCGGTAAQGRQATAVLTTAACRRTVVTSRGTGARVPA